MKRDEYGTVLNAPETFEAIAKNIRGGFSVLIAWTDEEGTQFDILFARHPITNGPVQGGIQSSDLFVSIMRIGAFGFDISNTDTHPSYYAEKLHLRSGGLSCDKLAELINGIKKSINK